MSKPCPAKYNVAKKPKIFRWVISHCSEHLVALIRFQDYFGTHDILYTGKPLIQTCQQDRLHEDLAANRTYASMLQLKSLKYFPMLWEICLEAAAL